MIINYKNKRVERSFCSQFKKSWKYPPIVKVKLEAAENYIIQAESLLDIVNYPPFHFHPLRGKRKGEWSLYLGNTGYRVVLIPFGEGGKVITEGDVLSKSRMIRIVEIEEVSNHYE